MSESELVDVLVGALLSRLSEPASARALAGSLAPFLHDHAEGEWMSTADAARYLGTTATALHKRTAARSIPCHQDRPGGRLSFRRSELDAWRCSGRADRFRLASRTGKNAAGAGNSRSPVNRRRGLYVRSAHNQAPPRRRQPSGGMAQRSLPHEQFAAYEGRRTRVEKNLYESSRLDPRGRPMAVYEIGYRDSTGKQRWQTVRGGITAARAERDRILGARAQPGARVLPNPRLRFGDAAEAWLQGLKSGNTRPTTQSSYANSIRVHLSPRWGRRRLDHVTVTDAVALVRELRHEGKAESTIATILRAASRVFAYARRHLGWAGQDPVALMESGERPRVSQGGRHRLFTRAELQDTLYAALEPFRTVFMLASVTGARESECLGLVWDDVNLQDCEAAWFDSNTKSTVLASASPSRPKKPAEPFRFRPSLPQRSLRTGADPQQWRAMTSCSAHAPAAHSASATCCGSCDGR